MIESDMLFKSSLKKRQDGLSINMWHSGCIACKSRVLSLKQ